MNVQKYPKNYLIFEHKETLYGFRSLECSSHCVLVGHVEVHLSLNSAMRTSESDNKNEEKKEISATLKDEEIKEVIQCVKKKKNLVDSIVFADIVENFQFVAVLRAVDYSDLLDFLTRFN